MFILSFGSKFSPEDFPDIAPATKHFGGGSRGLHFGERDR